MTRRIAVCIATYHRPALLERLLESLDALALPEGCELEVRIVDNDSVASARAVAHARSERGRLAGRLRYEVESERGISAARNRALEMGAADLVATIDDDEVASPTWLEALVATLDRTGADAVFGPVEGIYEASAPAWVVRGRFHDKRVGREGRPLSWNETRTSNALVRGEWFFARGLRFAAGYGLTGGEDTELFSRMALAGARFAASEEALVREEVPAGRATLGWLLRSAWTRTRCYHRVLAARQRRARRLRLALTVLARGARAALISLAGAPLLLAGRPERFYRGLLLWARTGAGLEAWLAPSRAASREAYGAKKTEASHV